MKPLKLIKYGHEYCNPCRVLKPTLAAVVSNFSDVLDFEDKDTYEMSPEEIQEAQIRAVPLLIIQKDGTEVWRHTGLTNQDFLESKIKQFLE